MLACVCVCVLTNKCDTITSHTSSARYVTCRKKSSSQVENSEKHTRVQFSRTDLVCCCTTTETLKTDLLYVLAFCRRAFVYQLLSVKMPAALTCVENTFVEREMERERVTAQRERKPLFLQERESDLEVCFCAICVLAHIIDDNVSFSKCTHIQTHVRIHTHHISPGVRYS